jgi:hypothetical protein
MKKAGALLPSGTGHNFTGVETMPILSRTKPSSHDLDFERQLKRAEQILSERPYDLTEGGLARLLAAEDGSTAVDRICAAECAFARRGWLSDRRTWPGYAQAGARRVA